MAARPSKTIERPALMRAAHQVLDDEPRIFNDPIAVGIVEGTSRREIESRATELLSPASKLLRSAIVLRSRYAEDRLADAIQRGARQYVVLGAGLDTFCLRQPSRAAEARIFEVDLAATQQRKLVLLASRGVQVPDNVAHIAVDLNLQSLAEALLRTGFEPRMPAFFSWLGVTQYLDERAVYSTLGYIAALARGSGVALSFNPPEETLDGLDLEEARAAAERARGVGEPWRTRPTAGLLISRLRALGFRQIEHLDPAQAERTYFRHRRDGLRAPRFEQLFSAFV